MVSTCIPPRETHENTCSSLIGRVQYDSDLKSVILIQDFSEERKQSDPEQEYEVQPS